MRNSVSRCNIKSLNKLIYESHFQRCSLNSLLELSLIDLIKVSNNKECLTNAKTAYRTNYDRATIEVRGPFVDDHTKQIEPNPSGIHLQSLDVVEYVFKNFCDSIYRLKILFEKITEIDAKQIISYINDKCFVSMETLTLQYCFEQSLDGLQHVLDSVYNLEISSNKQTEMVAKKSVHHHFNVLFPNIYSLRLDYVTASDWLYFDGHFSKLRKLG